MVVAKRQGREKPSKVEQSKVWGPEWGPQVKQTALLATPSYIGQAQGEKEKHIKEEPKDQVSLSLFSSYLSDWHALTPGGGIFLYILNKTEL